MRIGRGIEVLLNYLPLSTKIPTWPDLGSSPSSSGWKQPTNGPIYGMAHIIL
jgi:hypothetical protein